jgi:UDP-glucuronate decarboxylase
VVLRLTVSRSDVTYCPLPTDDPRRRWPDISRAIELLDWQPATSLEEGLEATIAWFADRVGAEEERTPVAAVASR